ncbi:MAG: hypothetical protein KAR35_03505 [Candidatus Heimdallarchaeota archaeon]|nr:hypothetical protein [Candidatus Heimdallarchaeota archaeon]MCK5048422.1 hypothetical protein [Candidatus Heimdallarchaeota archaeon]
MSATIRKIYQGLLYSPESTQVHPLIGLIILGIQFSFLISRERVVLMTLLVAVIIENIVYANFKNSSSLLRAIAPFLIIVTGISYLFGGADRAINIVVRLIAGALGFSFFFAVTNPSDLARSLENMRIPSKIAMIPTLALTMTPRVAKDAEETFEALTMRGEIKGSFLKWLPKVMAIFIASVIYRSEFLAQSLNYRGFNLQKRTHYRTAKVKISDLLRIVAWIGLVVAIILWKKDSL